MFSSSGISTVSQQLKWNQNTILKVVICLLQVIKMAGEKGTRPWIQKEPAEFCLFQLYSFDKEESLTTFHFPLPEEIQNIFWGQLLAWVGAEPWFLSKAHFFFLRQRSHMTHRRPRPPLGLRELDSLPAPSL